MDDEDLTFDELRIKMEVAQLMGEMDALMDRWRQRGADPMPTVSTACAYLLSHVAGVLTAEEFEKFMENITSMAIQAKDEADAIRPLH